VFLFSLLMKELLNSIAHGAVSLLATSVKRTEIERCDQLARSLVISQEIAAWRGNDAAELISLGQNCSTAWYLKSMGLKQSAYPFDWVATSPEIILHCLSDRFKTFLDRDQMVSRGVRAGHMFYHSGFFGHRNPKSLKADHEHYQRCTARFLHLMDCQMPVIFVSTVLNERYKRLVWADGFVNSFQRPENQTLKDFREMMRTICSINPMARFLFIEEYTGRPFSLKTTHSSTQCMWIRYCAVGNSTGFKYLDETDDRVARNLLSALRTVGDK